MATKIRLQRHGRKAYPFYKIVVADSRAPRDGKFIEKIGTYNPNTDPATVDLDFDRALYWLNTGAQPSDTARSILSHEGVLLKKHLLAGVKKAWKAKKDGELGSLRETLAKKKASEAKAALEAEQAANKAKAAEVAAKKQAEAEAKAAAEAPEEVVEAAPAEQVEETPAQEETPAEA